MSNGLIRATLFAALAVVTMPIQCGEIHHCQATIHRLFVARPMPQKILNRFFIFQLVIQVNPLKNAVKSINIRPMKPNRRFNLTLTAMMALGLVVSGCNKNSAPRAEKTPTAQTVPAAQKSASASRNLDWAGATLDKIEKDLDEIAQDNKIADTTALTSAFKSAHAKLAALRTAVAANEPDAGDLTRAVDFTKSIAGMHQTLLDRIDDLNGKQEAYYNLTNDKPLLGDTDIGKRLGEAVQTLAGNLLNLMAGQLEQKEIEAGDAEGAWNLQSLRCDQIMDEGRDEAAYLATKEDLKKNMREAGKTISLTPLDLAREQVRAARHQQQDAAMTKQKLANQSNQLNVQSQLLDEKSGELDDAVDKANGALDQAQQKIQQAIDQQGR